MTPISTTALMHNLTPLRRRLRWRDSLRAAWLSAGAGLGATAALLVAGRLHPLLRNAELLLIGLSLTMFLLCAGQVIAWLRPLSPRALARLGDARLQLDERLITALELAEGRLATSPAIRQAQWNDALHHLQRAPLPEAFPLADRKRLVLWSSVLAAVFIAIAALTLAPNPQERILQRRAEVADLLKTQIEQLEQVQADLLAEPNPLAAEKVDELANTLSDLIDRLEAARAEASPESALAALNEARQTLSRLDAERQAQQDALQSLSDALTGSDLAAAQQAAEALQQGDAPAAADALRQMGANPPTGAEGQSLAEALRQAADAVAGSNPSLAQSLQQAADALQSGDAQSIQQALQQMAQQVAQAGAQTDALAQAAEALQNIQQAQEALAQGREGAGVQRQLAPGTGTGAGAEGAQGGAGNGSGREDPGPGAEGLYSAGGTQGIIPTDNGPGQPRVEDYSTVYAPEHLGGEGGPFAVPPSQGSDGGGVDIGETAPNPNRPAGESTVPYTEVFGQYRDRAGAALDTDYIPLGMKDYVRQYFGALEPK
ncbi:MAG: hypothetical protein D6796_07100 [Caldilineae bacterium]|nr:MAG: hypothetical protein D6796_07100 [Caldilineae bacterium]